MDGGALSLDTNTVAELRCKVEKAKIKGMSKSNKSQLILALRAYNTTRFSGFKKNRKTTQIVDDTGSDSESDVKRPAPRKGTAKIKASTSRKQSISKSVLKDFKFKGKQNLILFTGFRSEGLKKELEKRGNTVQDNLTKKTEIVIAKDTSLATAALVKAREQGLKILDVKTFLKF